MLKQILAGLLAAALTAVPALAEVYTGSTVARSTVSVLSPAEGMIGEMRIRAGENVSAGDIAAQIRTTKVFATQDGTIARIEAEEGHEFDGTVLQLQPVSRYDVYCTLSGGYDTVSNNLIHSGEEVYLYCTNNGTHQGAATVTSIDGETFMAQATGGEFYNGEAVYIYRDPNHKYPKLLGKGTILAAAAEDYTDSGRIVKLHVREGEYVQRGELLYEIIQGEETEITIPESGIITACEKSEGDAVQKNDVIATLAPWDEILVAVQVEESAAAQIRIGDDAALIYACDSEETLIPGTVSEISEIAQDGCYTVYILPETAPEYLGMTVNVRIG